MINEFEVALYKRPNRYGLFHRPTKNWTCFGKKAWLIRKATELNMEMSVDNETFEYKGRTF